MWGSDVWVITSGSFQGLSDLAAKEAQSRGSRLLPTSQPSGAVYYPKEAVPGGLRRL